MLDNKTLSELSALNKKNVSPLTVITGIKYEASLIKAFNNVTFAYDPNWEYEQGNPTYPISFFYVKSMTEQMSSDVSQKPMLFYDTVADGKDATKGGLMNIVADNIINKPKEYKLDIIIPANDNTFKNNSFSFESMTDVNGFIFKNGSFKGSTALSTTALSTTALSTTALSTTARVVGISFGIVETLIKALYGTSIKALYGTSISATSILNTILQQQDYNKASLEFMWSNRRIIKLKLWNGWNFKYLVIKNLDITKTGENGDFYTGSLTCQEVPILTFRNQSEKSKLSFGSKLSSWTGNLIKSSVNVFIKAMTNTAGED